MDAGTAKLRYLIATHGELLRRLGVLFVLVGILGGAATAAYPPTTTTTELTDRSVLVVQSSSSATVHGDHELYHAGEQLVDEPVYVRSVTPNVTVTTSTRAPDGVAVSQSLFLVYEASSRDTGVFREQERLVASTTGTGPVETAATLDIDEVAATLEAMRAEIGNAGRVTVYLAVESAYDGGAYTGTMTDREPLDVSEDAYRVPVLSATAEHGTPVTTERPVEAAVFQPVVPSVGRVVVPHTTTVFVFLALFGGVGFVVVSRKREGIDVAVERDRIHRARYDEWISGGDLPDALDESIVVGVESLEALVDVAIDSQTRVIYDRAKGWYAVVTDGVTYRFTATEQARRLFD